MQNGSNGHGPDQGQREACSTLLIVLFLVIIGACGYCVYVLLKLIIEGVAAGLSQIGAGASSLIIQPGLSATIAPSAPTQPQDVYTMTASRLEPLLTMSTIVGWVLLGAAVLALIGLAIFVLLAIVDHYRKS